jgi:hypothetical protein
MADRARDRPKGIGRIDMQWFIAITLLIVFCGPANAYIDAGSGSYMLQMALAGIMALVFSIKLSWQRLRTYAANILGGRNRTTGNQA